MLPTSRPAAGSAPRQVVWPRLVGAATTTRAAVKAALDAAFATLRGAEHAGHVTRQRAEALADVAARAAAAPADVAREVRKELDAWSSGVARAGAIAVGVGILALFALIVLTVGAVVLLNAAVGDPYGTLLVGAFYVVAAAGATAWAVAVKREARAEVQFHAQHAREAWDVRAREP